MLSDQRTGAGVKEGRAKQSAWLLLSRSTSVLVLQRRSIDIPAPLQ